MGNSVAIEKEQSFLQLAEIKDLLTEKGERFAVNHPLNLFFKRLVDITFSLVALVVLSPIMLMVAILIKLDSKGEVIFKQERVGKDFQVFMMYKFRSMYQNAEQKTGPIWAKANDQRITPVGSFLRKTRLDEIPQLFNILKGDMSLIGPRPERLHFIRQFADSIENYPQRLLVKPGLTGWAQICHKYDSTVEDVKTKLSYDLHYVKNFSLLFDLKILLGTIPVVLTGKGAH